MVTINTTDDLLRALADNPEWKAAVRREILTEELLNLPARFNQFVAEQGQFNGEIRQFRGEQLQFNDEMRQFRGEQLQFNDEMRQFRDEQLQFNDEMRQFRGEQLQFNAKMEEFVVRTDRRFNTLANDIARIRGSYARGESARYAAAIASEMGFRGIRLLDPGELVEMTRVADTTDVGRGALRSFHQADLVIEATDDNGDNHYIALEVSYTADQRDTDRAIRNARLLNRFTGQPAHAAIASVRNVNEIHDTIASGQVFWYELDEQDPEVE